MALLGGTAEVDCLLLLGDTLDRSSGDREREESRELAPMFGERLPGDGRLTMPGALAL